MSAALTLLLVICTLGVFAVATWLLQRKFPRDNHPLIDTVDALLPQTQCAQCGFAGCRPYAEAVVEGAALNLCPPGGAALHAQLSRLFDHRDEARVPVAPKPGIAQIDETQCIGCTLCLPPCPVDAIVGAANLMHSVIDAECTGCELCVPACPVDCITILELAPPHRNPKTSQSTQPVARPCIACAQCDPACPVGLPAQALLALLHHDRLADAQQLGLSDCIECGLCDRACPSNIDMAQQFSAAKVASRTLISELAGRDRSKARFARHQNRAQMQQADAADKRAQRLRGRRTWS